MGKRIHAWTCHIQGDGETFRDALGRAPKCGIVKILKTRKSERAKPKLSNDMQKNIKMTGKRLLDVGAGDSGGSQCYKSRMEERIWFFRTREQTLKFNGLAMKYFLTKQRNECVLLKSV